MNIADQVLGGTLTHTEYNTHKNSNQNAITTSGQTLDSGNTNQLAIAAAQYAAVSTFYTESGAVNAYVLSSVGSFKAPHEYTNGMLIRFRAGNANTGASTVNVATLGVKNIKKADGSTDPAAGDIPTNKDTWARYDGTSFRLIEFGSGGVSSLDAITKDINQASHGFAVGDWLKVSGGAYAKAQADSIANCEGTVGVVSAVADVNNFTIQFAGYISGLSGLTANSVHYLDASTAGAETTTEPTISKPVIVADSTSSGVILPQRPIDSSASGLTVTASSYTSNGYITYSDGLIWQWGSVANSSSGMTVTYPITFPNNVFSPVVTEVHSADAAWDFNIYNITTSSFQIVNNNNIGTRSYQFIVVGN